MASNLPQIIIIPTSREGSLSNPVHKVIKTRVWEPLFELVYHFTIIENRYLIVQDEHFKQMFLVAKIFLFLNKTFLWLMSTHETRLFSREDQLQ